MATNKNKEQVAKQITPAYTSTSWGIRKLPNVRWMVDVFEHSFDADNNFIASKIVKSSEPMSWSFILETWKMWASSAISKMR